jgi:DNA-binding NarL/FixJ family response regulator
VGCHVSEDTGLIGRAAERAALDEALAAARGGAGGCVLLAGEPGVGKTRLLGACLAGSGLLALAGRVAEIGAPPYGPIVAALRAFLRLRPGALADADPLTPFLALLLPELGPPPERSDPATLVAAICHAFTTVARATPAALVLDDLQWADHATLALLPALAGALAQERLVIVGAYRSDEIPRAHPLRRLRHEMRRARLLTEIVVEPLDQAGTAALATRILGGAPGPALAAALYERTEGVPLFVEELAGALALRGGLERAAAGVELQPAAPLPMPDTLRDTLLLRLDGLLAPELRLIEAGAAAGREFDLALAAELAGGAPDVETLLARGLLVEPAPGRAAFRHALVRDAVYAEIPWLRRRELHRGLAARLDAEGAPPQAVAEHWLAAREHERARAALLRAAGQSCAFHAYHDAARAAQQALELWPDEADEGGRLELLARLGHCAQLCGLLPEAAHAWREVADGRRRRGESRDHAEAAGRLAAVAGLQGMWERALAARGEAALAYAACGLPAEAAAEYLAAVAHLRSAARFRAALDLLALAAAAAAQAARPDLQARCLALEGNVRARMGETAEGLALVRSGLALALEHNQAGAAAEIYQRLADALEHAGAYQDASDAYRTAFEFCQANALATTAQLCVACLTAVLRQTGEWDHAMRLCREVLAAEAGPDHARAVALGILGVLYAARGQARLAQPLLREAALLAQRIELAAIELYAALGMAELAELSGATGAAVEHCRAILARWEQIEDRHYVVPALRWAATCFARAGADADVRACANALARIASATAQPEALSALAHALGESALRDGDAAQAVQQFDQALALLLDVDVPYCRATSAWRAGVACAAAGQREAAVRHLASGYRAARGLGARPLAARIAQTLDELGEPVGERLGAGAAHRLRAGNLTRRQREILQLVAQGQTNAEIAHRLVLSPRTVEMHVANMLAALDCRSRAEVVRRAGELGLLDEVP